MNYLQKKQRAIMRNRQFKGYLKSVTGYPVNLPGCVHAHPVSISINGSEGGVGDLDDTSYKIPVVIGSKNLIDVATLYSDYKNDFNGISYTNKDASTILGVAIGQGILQKNQAYTLSCECEISEANNNGVTLIAADKDGNVLKQVSTGLKTNDEENPLFTFSLFLTVENASYFAISYGTGGRAMNVVLKNIQLEIGEEATDYEPYFKPNTYNVYAQEPLYTDDVLKISKEALRKITLPEGDCRITLGTSIKPSGMTVEYYGK